MQAGRDDGAGARPGRRLGSRRRTGSSHGAVRGVFVCWYMKLGLGSVGIVCKAAFAAVRHACDSRSVGRIGSIWSRFEPVSVVL
jgi:hypothetical protein